MAGEGQVVVYDPRKHGRANMMEQGVGMVEHGSAEQQQKRWIKSLLWMFASIGVFLVVLIFLGIIVWLIIRPKSPDMTLQAVRIDDLKVKQVMDIYNATLTQLYMNIVFQLSVTNGNRVGARYSSFLLNVTYNNVTVGDTMFQSFELDAHTTVPVESWMLVDNLNIFNHASELVADARNDRVPFQIAGQTDVHVHTVGFKSQFRLRLTCVIVIQYAELALDSKECNIDSIKI